ncbi:MAG: DUF4173 domain-containing protein [Planctomycetaceae bacterium]|jgi:hypothetical protein|nr:DUF4173 domain-containing protein [Planctomycetaceae bacterium]
MPTNFDESDSQKIEVEAEKTCQPDTPASSIDIKLERNPIHWREVTAVILAVILADITIYRSSGMDGSAFAVLIIGLSALLFLGINGASYKVSTGIFCVLASLTAFKLFWCGSFPALFCGFFVVLIIGLLLNGYKLRVGNLFALLLQLLCLGWQRIADYVEALLKIKRLPSIKAVCSVIIPIVAICIFSGIFILANPDVITWVTDFLQDLQNRFQVYIDYFFPTLSEVFVWIVAAWLMIGLLRPAFWANELLFSKLFYYVFVIAMETFRFLESIFGEESKPDNKPVSDEQSLYRVYRNMLIAVIVLFAFYLIFEFATLWFREFPVGFYYAGYAHQGAAWLTVALIISTLILLFVFDKAMYADRRVDFIKFLARIWSIENIILAIAVYNRLGIYINFNGMTRMRIVGILGVSAVLIGFLFMMVKISKRKNIDWLFQRYAFAVLSMVFLWCILPVDMIAHSYNTRRALQEYYAPTVQMSVQPNSAEGYLTMIPLLNCKDEHIREGIRAILADELKNLRKKYNNANNSSNVTVQSSKKQTYYKWTQYQLSEKYLLKYLEEHKDTELKEYLDGTRNIYSARKNFDNYVYQWF